MSVDRTLAVMLRVLRQLRRDHRSMAMILVAPPLLLTIVWGIYYHEAGIFDRIGPLMLGLFPFTSIFLVTSIITLRERSQGTLDRLMVSPIGRGDIMSGYAAAFLIVATLQTLITTVTGIVFLDMSMRGSVSQTFVLVLALALFGITLGLFLSAFAHNEFQVAQFMPIAILPQVFFAGLLVPVDQMPEVLRWIAAVMPLRYAFDALLDVSVRGLGWFSADVWVSTAITLVVPFVVLGFGWMTLRRTNDE